MNRAPRIVERSWRGRLLAGLPIIGGIAAGLLLIPFVLETMRLESAAGLAATMISLFFSLTARPQRWRDWMVLGASAFLSIAAAIVSAALLWWLAGGGAELPHNKRLFAIPLAGAAAMSGAAAPWLLARYIGRRIGLWDRPGEAEAPSDGTEPRQTLEHRRQVASRNMRVCHPSYRTNTGERTI